jgi:hypothetical protein
MKLLKFVNQERAGMLRALEHIVKDLQRSLKADPGEYTEFGADEPTIDVRLCIDLWENDPNNSSRNGWIFRTGSSDYDPYFSEYCAGLCVGLDTNAEDLLDELINQLEEFC